MHPGSLILPPPSELSSVSPSFLIKSPLLFFSAPPAQGWCTVFIRGKNWCWLVEASRDGLPRKFWGAQWKRSLGLINEVCCDCCSSNGDFCNKNLYLSPGLFFFRGEEEAFFMGIFIRCLALMSDSLVSKAGWNSYPIAAIREGDRWWYVFSHIRSSRPFVTWCTDSNRPLGQAHLILSCIRKITLITTPQTELIKIDGIRLWPVPWSYQGSEVLVTALAQVRC